MAAKRLPSRLILAASLLFAATLPGFPARAADEVHPASLMPPVVLAYAEISQPAAFLDVALDPQWKDALATLPDVKKALQSKDYQQLQQVLGVVEQRLGMKWQEALRGVVDGGIYVGVDVLGKGVVIVKARDAELLQKASDLALDLAAKQAEKMGQASPIKSAEYKGFKGYSLGKEARFAIVDNMLVASNTEAGVKSVIDRYQGKKRLPGLEKMPDFLQARKMASSSGGPPAGWGMVRLVPFRLIPGISKAFDGPRDNPGIEFLIGGLFESLKDAQLAVWSVDVKAGELAIRSHLPYDASKVSEKRQWFFDKDGREALPLVRPPGTILSATGYRNLEEFWHAREELFEENVNGGFSQAESQLALFFSGRDFATDVLGEMGPRTRFVVTRQEYAKDQPVPGIKIPGFAGVVEMKDPDKFSTNLIASYQKIVGIISLTGSMEGRASLLMETETHEGATIYKARYLPGPDVDKEYADFVYNFAPSCARVGNYFIFGSSVSITRDLVKELKNPAASQPTGDNLVVETDLAQLADILQDNIDALVTQNVLQEGTTRDEAEKNVGVGLSLLKQMKVSRFRLAHDKETLTLEMAIGLPKPK
ncbi:MAG: hypothetical protein HYS13_06675 [Planctomycetia bacterium]|nr:hypothetical protein [Planctomycetia bacterium]